MVIDWNGDVVLCCDDWNHSTVLGNLKEQTIEEIWNGEKLRNIRKAHINGEFYKVRLCSECNKKSVWWMIN
jgi:radical SAM protein with 4Fe4S-binding SPASM domain